MKIARVRVEDQVWLARVEGGEAVLLAQESVHPGADALREALAAGVDLHGAGPCTELDGLQLLAPVVRPSKILAIGLNYADHASEIGAEIPTAPLVFAKAPSAVIGPGDLINWRDQDTAQVDYEAELAVVIGTRASGALEDPLAHVFGFTVCNDVSARDAQFADGQWVRGKSFDTFCPVGPWIVTRDELDDCQRLRIGCTVSGDKLQDGTTADMIFSVAELVAYLARFIILEAGDLIATGTPAGVGYSRQPPRYLADGEDVTCWVEGIGELTNPVAVRWT
jgi:2-keto-4-pentenoate hydratase/2-oxohepta-3-ene-1,7-dioic acid hydratase in catechol pathway